MERILTILENTPLAPGVFRLLLDGAEADDVRAPGQFFNLSVDGFYLRRPISVCDAAAAASPSSTRSSARAPARCRTTAPAGRCACSPRWATATT